MLKNEQNIIAEATKELVKPVYDDGLKPGVKATGKALGTILDCFNMLLAPLERAQLASVAKTEAFKRSLEMKYDEVPHEMKKEPDLKTVYQIADKLKYNLDNDTLRDMFENLLISSMMKKSVVLPSYINAVDMMSAKEAHLFKSIYDSIYKEEWKRETCYYFAHLHICDTGSHVSRFNKLFAMTSIAQKEEYSYPIINIDTSTMQFTAVEFRQCYSMLAKLELIESNSMFFTKTNSFEINSNITVYTHMNKQYLDILLDLEDVKEWIENDVRSSNKPLPRCYTINANACTSSSFGSELYEILRYNKPSRIVYNDYKIF